MNEVYLKVSIICYFRVRTLFGRLKRKNMNNSKLKNQRIKLKNKKERSA